MPTKPFPEKLSDQSLREMKRLARDRCSDSLFTVLQLIDDPEQAAKVTTSVAVSLFLLAAKFSHTDLTFKGEAYTHDQIVDGLIQQCAKMAREAPPSPMERKLIETMKRRLQ